MSTPPGGNEARETLIFTCAGAAYSGQVANRAGVTLAQSADGNLFCIAAMAAGVPDKIARARAAGRRIVIDGCEDHCAGKVMLKARLPVDLHLDVTTLGIAKKPAQPAMIDDSRRVAAWVSEQLRSAR